MPRHSFLLTSFCTALLMCLSPHAYAQTLSTTQCLHALEDLAEYEQTIQPESADPACTIPAPVKLFSVRGNSAINLPNTPTLDCQFALTFASFLRDRAQPLAEFHLNTSITEVITGPGFTCRRRNNAPEGKLSEHAFGNGVDIASFSFANGRRLGVKSAQDLQPDEASFSGSFRKQSCTYFTTVLGPGSNTAHASHFHFDLGRSKNNPNPYQICD